VEGCLTCEELVGVKLFLELVQIVRKILFGNERNYLLFYPLVCYTNLSIFNVKCPWKCP